MTTARLLLALVGSATAQAVVDRSIVSNLSVAVYPDVADECDVGMQCPKGLLTDPARTVRSICVATAGGSQCWDACNSAHAVKDYSTTNTDGVALMIKQLRTGMRYGSCPGGKYTPVCNAGERCTPAGLTWGRGMCTTITGQGNQCLDMCNEAITLADFKTTPGKQSGTIQIIEMVRAGRDPIGRTTCPLTTIWVWLWLPLLACCAIAICAGTFYAYRTYAGRSKRGANKGYREPEQPYADDQAPYVDYGQDYQQDPEFQQDYAQGYDQNAMPPPQTMEQMQMEDPMPVVDQGLYEPALAPAAAPLSGIGEPNIFDGVMAAPLTMAPSTMVQSMPMGTVYPAAGQMTMAPQYQSSMMVSGAQGYTTAPQYTSSMMVAPVGTQLPSYGAYGAYGGAAPTTVYPGTTSMRIG